ncbi:hypothetical protein A3K34_04400 [candidate division WWE3 bacterium RIFOXYC1_FULL_40_10]|uniref:PPM-type phosphatase domain-containing protein n=1 Tax=candidate division WWE3 bacterium RIFOXYA2_FULL_46_9 TaxID=1802636 RepID=A0A1F4W1E2_UNCKA|nr:MAG: hypothetical protein A3K58_04400 [candidate division WWE3 bacterium RIFOXYB1_FULL_40_22]OGC62083.1 MAG: hypothetical protein A3K37_04400 [candidate division WWE3 bacterium RIFOXYA1_FULL_40_11]OGC63098.1 MAG: hypothetical protein A2264_00145 [candidate division WWE3 bacterium RIFOXYA2_FULL_46_9]OGC64972.1 MAG: hypothetical protein A2326_02965 [candidate division WWE3 bacterium RIFOXYB2_FULL_41_6]OGC66466.1 MAG: hypothetical protein A3K34_04400 [candidate division WWE3 bacterium RIFOXYC1_
MKKRLIAKLQKLEPALNPGSNVFSKCISIEPETKDKRLKKGLVYGVFSFSSPYTIDSAVVEKIVNDVIEDSYYQSDNISPTQSMEKALLELREKLVKSVSAKQQLNKGSVKFDIATAVLWGNVLYVVVMGDADTFLMREGKIRPINTMSEGNFSAASGVIKNDEVIVLATKQFSDFIDPIKLLTQTIATGELNSGQACLVAKVIEDTSFTESEVVDFGIEENTPLKHSLNTSRRIKDFLSKLAGIFPQKKAVENTPGGPETKKSTSEEVPSIVKRTLSIKPLFSSISNYVENLKPEKTTQQDLPYRPTIKILSKPVTKKRKRIPSIYLYYAIPVIGTLIIIVIISSVIRHKKNPVPETIQDAVETSPTIQEESNSLGEEDMLEDTSKDAEDKTQRVGTEAFYDMLIIDPDAKTNSLVATLNGVAVADSEKGTLYYSGDAQADFKKAEKSYQGIRSMAYYDSKLSFADNSGYITLNPTTFAGLETLSKEGLGLVSPYLSFVYGVQGDKIIKYSKTGTTLTETLWAQNADFYNAKDMEVAYSIYLITQNNAVVSYTSGEKDEFVINGLSTPLTNPTQLTTSLDFSNIYITDYDNRRIVVIDKKGNYIKQYKAVKPSIWKDIRSIGVNQDEATLWVLDGTRIYNVDLKASTQ